MESYRSRWRRTMDKGLVNVLISTYNGVNYVGEQIDSILNQTYKSIKIYVRDDGSTDGTKELLKTYEDKGLITYLEGENIRYGRSFMKLVEYAQEGDYWDFCDQDDVWLEDKVLWAVDWFEQNNNQEPLLFHSAYKLMNADLSQVIGTHEPPNYNLDFRRALTDCLYQGFSLVFNRSLRDLMLKADIEVLDSHDWWADILVAKYGTAYFDPRIASLHRRLGDSMSGASLSNKIKWFKKTLTTGKSDIGSCAREYVRVFGQDMGDKDSRIARWFSDDHYHFLHAVTKAFYPKRWRPSISSEVSIRLLMLLGKI